MITFSQCLCVRYFSTFYSYKKIWPDKWLVNAFLGNRFISDVRWPRGVTILDYLFTSVYFFFSFSVFFLYFPSAFFFNSLQRFFNPFLLFNHNLNWGCLVYVFSLHFSGSKLLINLRRKFLVRKIFSCT